LIEPPPVVPPSAVNANIARHLAFMAEARPDRAALKVPRGRTPSGDIDYLALTFAELDAEVDAWCAHAPAAGVRRGDRTLVMVKQGLPLIASVFALFKLGAVPVVIDPGMGLKAFLGCVRHSRPTALVGIPLAQLLCRAFRRPFVTVKIRVAARSSLTARLTAPGTLPPALRPPLANSAAADLAAVLFTSGSTGAPKGVCYEHGMFDAQVRLIRETYGIEPGEIDLPMLPLFALFNPALGLTTIVPEIDPRRPATVNPQKIVQAIRQESVTNSFGSPTLWTKIADHCLATGVTLPSLRRVLCAGAPVPAALWEKSRHFLPHGRLHSPYGATEALPVSTISSADTPTQCHVIRDTSPPELPSSEPGKCHVLRDTLDRSDSAVGASLMGAWGACVGWPIRGIEVKIIAIADGPIATLADARELPPGQIGEIIVHGPVVTQLYDAAPEVTALAKIRDAKAEEPGNNHRASPLREQGTGTPGEKISDKDSAAPAALESFGLGHLEFETSAPLRGAAWHRMGDCGYFDQDGRLWFCGRKVERVETAAGPLFTEPCERVFRPHPRVGRCALIGLGERGRQRPALVVETAVKNPGARRTFARELRALALTHRTTAAIDLFYFHPRFPVDVRHNAKIHRLALAKWAATAKAFKTEDPHV
jgi:acyl-CoA synthetase (AMP-forming)/AMP-acid ligase II